ncbi:peptide/nickel transport system substrate-binding protein [Palleronia marisminoris]|uniref:Putative ABC transporter-binding protein n=1 Tax=Palleronia marisminoris TaxID=315423 RepID=A0A1Y5TTK4_9RHOB|nr:ABC transporter substrate-binding protein [Palleronia marisminoris]SFH49324.1 peptide/nickel transport system substrate-binding protein [Palleronia marisminoris]SLN69895.1 putative ABC transporter-binding protein precursor [Palleronia marisminoris]
MTRDIQTERSASGRRLASKLMLSAAIVPMLSLHALAQGASGEAPALADMVAAGDLPPVAERVGSEPEVITPLNEIGTYGGDLRIGLRGSSDHNHILRVVGPQGLVRWDPEYTEIVPNVAESFEVTEEGRVFTFNLRDGMKWSDGEPFTADDVLFNINDLVLNEEFAPTPPRYMTGDDPVEIEKIDDYTVRMTFTEPYGDFLAELASPLGQHPVLYAKHYCSQFLPSYSDDIETLISENNATDWQNLYLQKCGDLEIPSRWGNPDRPTLDPWVIKDPYVGGTTRVVLERNPYFWQIDTEGNQLPYIDQIVAPIDQDVESLILSVIGGKIDFGLRHIDPPMNRPVLAENREAGDYKFFEAKATGGTDMIINLNLTHKDPAKRELFNMRDFRVALSLGMDRQEIIDTVMLGQGEPWQQGPFADHPYYHEKIATQFLEYDPEQANALLDGLGLEMGDDGVRRMANGDPLRFQVDVIPTYDPTWVDALQIIEQQWAEIGVDMEINPLERTFFYERTSNSNDHDAAIWNATQSWVPGQIPQHIIPVHHDSRWGVAWRDWYLSGGESGEEPPASIKQRMDLYDAARGMTDAEERIATFQQIADIAAEEFEVIGVHKAIPTYGIVKNDLANVPRTMPNSWYYPTPAPALPQSWFWKDE